MCLESEADPGMIAGTGQRCLARWGRHMHGTPPRDGPPFLPRRSMVAQVKSPGPNRGKAPHLSVVFIKVWPHCMQHAMLAP